MANAPLGCRDGTQKRRIVVVVGPKPKPGAQVADFGAVKKTLASRHLVRNARLAQGLLEWLGLVVGAVQHRKVAELLVLLALGGCAIGAQALDAGYGALGLVLLVVGIHHAHRLAFAQLAEQRLGKQLGIRANHVVGSTQDGAGGAVVLLQFDDLQRRKIHRQFFEVVQRGAAPAVDGLVVIPHRGEAGAICRIAAGQQLEHFVLRGVGVLVLVHQYMAHQPLPLLPDLLMIL